MSSRLPGPGPRPGSPVQNALLREVREAASAGAPLPGEFELMERLGYTRQQVRNALSELEQLGILRRRQGAATTVDPIALRMSVRLEDQFEHSDLLARLGYEPGIEVLESEAVPLTAEVARLIDAEPGSPSIRTVKRWRADGRVVMLASGYLLTPDDTAREVDESVFIAAPEVWGESLLWEVATPGAVAVDERVAELLELPVGSAVMTLELIGLSASGRRVFYAFEHHLPDVVRYSFARTVRPPWGTL